MRKPPFPRDSSSSNKWGGVSDLKKGWESRDDQHGGQAIERIVSTKKTNPREGIGLGEDTGEKKGRQSRGKKQPIAQGGSPISQENTTKLLDVTKSIRKVHHKKGK